MTPFVNSFRSEFISAYRKTYSTNHALIRLIENWKKSLDQNKFVGAVLMDLSIVTRNGKPGNTGRLNRNLYVMLKFTERPKTPGITSKKT